MNQRTRYAAGRRSRRKKRIRAVKRAVIMLSILAALVLVLCKRSSNRETEETGWTEVQAPVKRETPEVYQALNTLAETNANAQKIYEDRMKYPEKLLAAYLNNPEMEEFLLGYPAADPEQTGTLTDIEKQESYPLLLQWDKRWGYAPYGESIIALSGCGPVCLSMVVVTLTGNAEWTPEQVARFSEDNGYYVEGAGTSWSLMLQGARQLGVSAEELPLSEAAMKAVLDEGGAIICTLRPGDFTTEGHYIVIRGYDETGFLVNDPNCIARSNLTWSFDKLHGQIKNLWGYKKSSAACSRGFYYKLPVLYLATIC